MLITFKTLQQKTFKIEIEETETVKTLKEKIFAERGNEFPVDGQKLIYAGKILDDEKPISEYKIDPVKNFVVVMAVKPKAKPSEATSTETSSTSATSSSATSSSTQGAASSTSPQEASSTSTTTTTTHTSADSSSNATTTTTTTASVTSAESALLTGSDLETSITELMSLGYSREQVMRALNSSFHNADRAAEYLLSGNIPDIGVVGDAESTEPTEGGDNTSEAVPAATISPQATGDLSFLRNLPQFQLMRNQLLQNPEQLPQLLQEIGRSNPQLLQLISQNQEAFIQLLNESSPGGGDGGGDGGGAAGGGGFQIQVTTQEKESIDRIVAMGFPENEVIQAFFACEKNEALTVDFLLSQ